MQVEKRGSYPGFLDLHHDHQAPVRRREGVFDVAGWLVYEPAHGPLVHAPHAQPAVGSGLGNEEHPTPVGEPGRRDLDPRTKVHDLAVFDALYVREPDLLSGRVRLVARVEHVSTLTVQLGPGDTTLLGSGQHQPFA